MGTISALLCGLSPIPKVAAASARFRPWAILLTNILTTCMRDRARCGAKWVATGFVPCYPLYANKKTLGN